MTTHAARNTFHCRLLCGVLGLSLLGAVAGCIVQPVGGQAYVAPAPVYVAPAPVYADTVVGIDGGLIYYPNYEVYFDPGARLYWYNRGGRWVNGPGPYGISVDVLLRSPSVRMDFRDSPANHHGEVVRRYPRDWQPQGRGRGDQGDHGNPGDNGRGNRGR